MYVICDSIGQDDECINCGASKVHWHASCESCPLVQNAKCKQVYKVIEHDEDYNITGEIFINEKGSDIIWKAYSNLWPNDKNKEHRETTGYVCWIGELENWKSQGILPADFNYKEYLV